MYIKDNRLSATGEYKFLKDHVEPARYENLSGHYPVWVGRKLVQVLDKIDELFEAAGAGKE